MTPKYRQFIFENYHFEPQTGLLELHYSLDGQLQFTETFRFDFKFVDYDESALDRAMQALFFMAGVSYYKTYVPPEIIIKAGQLDAEQASFLSKTYQRGLGEFWYVNKLDPRTPVVFPHNSPGLPPLTAEGKGEGLLVGIGGGKDSLVSVELLRGKVSELTTWSLDHRPQLTPLIEKIGTPHLWIEREWDKQLLTLNQQDAFNGHVPISAIIACVGAVAAILSGRRDVVVSNEQSTNEPTLHYNGVAINHQYSKSQEFEQDFQQFLYHTLGERVRYYSFLRPLSEVRIAEIFAKVGFEKYRTTFSSCNRAFVHSSDHMFWDGTCPKCAFIFLALTPFVPRTKLEALFSGKNLLKDPALEPLYRQLLGIDGDKPLECVGEIKENREAMQLAFQQYPELAEKYQFYLPEDYDFRALKSHEMPSEIFQAFQTAMTQFART